MDSSRQDDHYSGGVVALLLLSYPTCVDGLVTLVTLSSRLLRSATYLR